MIRLLVLWILNSLLGSWPWEHGVNSAHHIGLHKIVKVTNQLPLNVNDGHACAIHPANMKDVCCHWSTILDGIHVDHLWLNTFFHEHLLSTNAILVKFVWKYHHVVLTDKLSDLLVHRLETKHIRWYISRQKFNIINFYPVNYLWIFRINEFIVR